MIELVNFRIDFKVIIKNMGLIHFLIMLNMYKILIHTISTITKISYQSTISGNKKRNYHLHINKHIDN